MHSILLLNFVKMVKLIICSPSEPFRHFFSGFREWGFCAKFHIATVRKTLYSITGEFYGSHKPRHYITVIRNTFQHFYRQYQTSSFGCSLCCIENFPVPGHRGLLFPKGRTPFYFNFKLRPMGVSRNKRVLPNDFFTFYVRRRELLCRILVGGGELEIRFAG